MELQIHSTDTVLPQCQDKSYSCSTWLLPHSESYFGRWLHVLSQSAYFFVGQDWDMSWCLVFFGLNVAVPVIFWSLTSCAAHRAPDYLWDKSWCLVIFGLLNLTATHDFFCGAWVGVWYFIWLVNFTAAVRNFLWRMSRYLVFLGSLQLLNCHIARVDEEG